MVRMDGYAFDGDPLSARGLVFEEVTFASELGQFRAWLVPGETVGPWMIFVHGKGGDRGEALRILPTVHEAGFTALVITYRNDAEVRQDPSGYHRYGATEWEEVEAAAQFAVDGGAERIGLYGYSMGGGIAMSFLYRSPLAERVCGVVLDAPMLDFGETIDFRADERGLPGTLTATGKKVADWRFDIDWGEVDYNKRADELNAPVLLIHGEEDGDVPIATSEELVERRPDLVRFERFEDAGHVRAWNSDQARYEAAVGEFLAGLEECR